MAQPNQLLSFSKSWSCSKTNTETKNFEAMLDKIIAGQPLQDEDPFLKMSEDVLSDMKYYMGVIRGESKSYKRISSVYTCMSHGKFIDIVDSFDKPFSKNESFATALANKGDQSSHDNQYGSALLCYNLALSFAPPASQILAEIYSKRATLFMETYHLLLALNDIHAARLVPELSPNLKSKLQRQKDGCVKRNMETGTQAEVVMNLKNQSFANRVIFQVEGKKNPKIPSAAAYIELRFTPEKGRHLVTTKDLDPGVTSIVEEPFVCVMDNCMTWEMKYCFTCYKRIWRTVPCNSCVFAIYCSETCRKKDYENGHKYLCPCLPFLHFSGDAIFRHLALKAVCRAGPEYMFKAYKESPTRGKLDIPNIIPGFDPTSGIYASDSHYQMEHLINHTRDEEELNNLAFSALSLALVLETKSTFFSGVPETDKLEYLLFISCVLLRHICAFPTNGVELRKPTETGDPKLAYPRGREFQSDEDKCHKRNGMIALFSLFSMMSHSCDPTAAWAQSKDGKLAIVTKRNIKAGEEILISYAVQYTTDSFEERLEWTTMYYRFKCACNACALKWPLRKDIPAQLTFLCPKCTKSNFSQVELNESCWLNECGDYGSCGKCKSKFKMSTLIKEESKYAAVLEIAFELISSRKYLDALPLVVQCISYYQNNIQSPSEKLITSERSLLMIYGNVIDL